ncbi:phosphopantetheine-binding protein [Kitasatospora sp. NPDC101155]|uniref:phosphopantetheine-binding protein n=1 Tax=Kitasatospora sp. NPDC101155 TaxID=3364097 RepID=UPI00380BD0E8
MQRELDVIEKEITALWAEALGLDSVAGDEDFFDLGGTSITAIRLLPEITERFGVEPTIGVIFDHPTAREMAAVLADLGARVEG